MSLFPHNRVLVAALAVALTMLVPTGSVFAKPGNSLNAKNCYKGGWAAMTQPDETSFFASQDACVSYGAHGGTYRRVFAIAFTNLDGVAGFNSATDVLITDIVDSNGDNTVDAGDTVHANRYPLDQNMTGFGTFQATTHVITSAGTVNSTRVLVNQPDATYVWDRVFSSGALFEDYLEQQFGAQPGIAAFNDRSGYFGDLMNVTEFAPSRPSIVTFASLYNDTEDPYIDIIINVP